MFNIFSNQNTNISIIESNKKTLIILLGPESSATRIFTELFSQHPSIQGTENASGHGDVLDDVWQSIRDGNNPEPNKFPKIQNEQALLTRRSLPHGPAPGKAAKYMNFASIEKFSSLAEQAGFNIFLMITTRSVVPNLISWKKNRASTSGSFEKAYEQYKESYKHIFSFLSRTNEEYILLSLEALIESPSNYVNSIFKLIGLDKSEIEFDPDNQVNSKHYNDILNG